MPYPLTWHNFHFAILINFKPLNNKIVVSQFLLFYFNVSTHFSNKAKKIWPFKLGGVLHGTLFFDTLMFFGHSHQKDKNLKNYHRLLLLTKSCHHLAISPFVIFFAFAFEVALLFFVVCLTSLNSCVGSSCCCVSYLFKLLTLLVVVMCFISLSSCVVSSCCCVSYRFKLLTLLVVVMCFISLSLCVVSSCCCVSYLFKLLTLLVVVMCFISLSSCVSSSS